jgi:hypothetical protein
MAKSKLRVDGLEIDVDLAREVYKGQEQGRVYSNGQLNVVHQNVKGNHLFREQPVGVYGFKGLCYLCHQVLGSEIHRVL